VRYLERLLSDFKTDLAQYENGQIFVGDRLRQIDLLILAIDDPQTAALQPDRFVAAVEQVSWITSIRIDRNVYEELVSTGRMTLVSSESLRESLSTYFSEIDHWESVIAASRVKDEYVSNTAGLLDKEALRLIEENASTWGGKDSYGVEDKTAVAIAVELASRPQATRWLPRLYQHHILVKKILELHTKRASAVVLEIERQLGK
jgi:hypothetical protein